MAERKGSPRIDPRILILFLILGMLPLVAGTLILLYGSKQAYGDVIGSQVSEIADYTQTSVSSYLQQMMIQIAALSTVPAVKDVVLEANRQPAPPEPTLRQIQEIESEWANLRVEDSALLRGILQNPAAVFLRDYQHYAPSFREILITDGLGRLVAASSKTSDYLQADEEWWHYCYREGAGGHYLGGMTFDASAGVYALEIAEPLIDIQTGEFQGVIKVLIDAQDIFAMINSIRVGNNGYAMLLDGDGTILVSRDATVSDQRMYPYFGDVLAGSFRNRQSLPAGTEEARVFLGLPRMGLEKTFPDLDWYVVVEVPYDEAFSPFQNVIRNFVVILIFSAAVVVGLSLVFTWFLTKPIIETDPHLEKV